MKAKRFFAWVVIYLAGCSAAFVVLLLVVLGSAVFDAFVEDWPMSLYACLLALGLIATRVGFCALVRWSWRTVLK